MRIVRTWECDAGRQYHGGDPDAATRGRRVAEHQRRIEALTGTPGGRGSARPTQGNSGGRKPRPVVCIETGRRFASLALAAAFAHTQPDNVLRAVRKGYAAGGYHWRAA